ncbi:MAG: hypothetical protein EXS05_11355 [Planctomycetaceae bacterium]|nr:hypothetical protein [Planctomycetaceae bacterium]
MKALRHHLQLLITVWLICLYLPALVQAGSVFSRDPYSPLESFRFVKSAGAYSSADVKFTLHPFGGTDLTDIEFVYRGPDPGQELPTQNPNPYPINPAFATRKQGSFIDVDNGAATLLIDFGRVETWTNDPSISPWEQSILTPDLVQLEYDNFSGAARTLSMQLDYDVSLKTRTDLSRIGIVRGDVFQPIAGYKFRIEDITSNLINPINLPVLIGYFQLSIQSIGNSDNPDMSNERTFSTTANFDLALAPFSSRTIRIVPDSFAGNIVQNAAGNPTTYPNGGPYSNGAPEIDPNSFAGALTLLIGGVLLLQRRQKTAPAV